MRELPLFGILSVFPPRNSTIALILGPNYKMHLLFESRLSVVIWVYYISSTTSEFCDDFVMVLDTTHDFIRLIA